MRIKRLLALGLTLVALSLTIQTEAEGSWRHRRCTYQGLERRSWTKTEVKRSIACGTDHWRVPGGRDRAVAIAKCESGLRADARGPGTSAGVFQFISSTWDSTVHRFRRLVRRWDLSRNVFNGRSNVVLAIRKAHADGWSAWACA